MYLVILQPENVHNDGMEMPHLHHHAMSPPKNMNVLKDIENTASAFKLNLKIFKNQSPLPQNA